MESLKEQFCEFRVEVEEVRRLLNRILNGQKTIKRELKIIMSQQDDLNTLVASENADLAAIGAAIQTVSDEVKAIITANPAVDFSGLKTAEAQLAAVAGNVLAVVPAPPTPKA